MRNRSLQLIFVLSLYFCIANVLPASVAQGFYTISIFIKDILMWLLPVTVMLFIADTICAFERKAILLVVSLMLFEALSNFTSVCYAFGAGQITADFLPWQAASVTSHNFPVLWSLPFTKPAWWSASRGSVIGLLCGLIAVFHKNPVYRNWLRQGKECAHWLLSAVFSRLIPLYVLGLVIKMHKSRLIEQILQQYASLLLCLIGFLALYLLLLFYLASDGTLKGLLRVMRNLLPAGGLAFCSGCSVSTMPWTIEGTAKNLHDPSFAKAIIPATTNIQQIGDCIINTFLCFLIYRHFYGHNPDVLTWVNFSVVFVLARFATAAIIGGAIFIMLPIYESYLSFNAEMIAIILAFNVILDPLVTSCNVLANGALCSLFEKVWRKLVIKPLEK